EYAIVGLQLGVSIVSLEDPENAVEVARIPGQFSTWRDMKTWGHFAYITTDQGGTTEGVTVIDLSQLPEAAPYYHWTPDLEGLGLLQTCHNIYIDEFGYAYLAGCNLNSGGMLILDVDTETGEPELVTAAPPVYAHDVYVVNNHMYSSEIYVGNMTVYDVSDKQNIQALGTRETPFSFTHNVWLNEDETVAFTTDELADAPVAAYDVTNFSEIEELDQYRPIGSLGSGVIPHNVHVWDDYLLISYYSDGGRVVDASRPENLIEVGNYDTWLGADGGFSGAWGLYPFLPSQTVLVTDISNGLYVLQPDFKRACWLEGMVTDSITQAPINGATVVIDSEQPNLGISDPFGEYATGQVLAGTFSVTFEKPGYKSKTVEVDLDNGVLTELDVELAPLQQFSITGQAVRDADGQPVPGAFVQAFNDVFTYNTVADANGNFTFNSISEGTYQVVAGSWGYLHTVIESVALTNNTAVTVELEPGYQDDFLFDFEWFTSSTATSGDWELGIPVGTTYQGTSSHPGFDAPDDLGTSCYSTGNGGGNAGGDDIDNGVVVLRSPVMDLSNYDVPMLSLSYWFFNSGGQPGSVPNDEMEISITNGTTEVEIATINQSLSLWRKVQQVNLADLIDLTDDMRLIVRASDDQAEGHLVEAGLDKVLIEEAGMPSNTESLASEFSIEAFPNPTTEAFTVSYNIPQTADAVNLVVYNALGQEVEHQQLNAGSGQFRFGGKLNSGSYFAHLMVDGETIETVSLVKQ
ncbi:MAG: choice-of-anchor B family protein, partial [Mameliella sp.]|nr:choice-of-anchor B family protein [Phaeodactylibacter sp.]